MRTTLDIDGDILAAAREKARAEKISVGKALSLIARRALVGPAGSGGTRNGIPLFPVGDTSQPVTLDLVNALRDEAP